MSDSSKTDRGESRNDSEALDHGSIPGDPAPTALRASPSSNAAIIERVEETARIEKRVVETGRVRVSTRTETTEQVLTETLRGDAVSVTRVPVDRVIGEGEAAPQIRNDGGLTIIPVLEEVLVVEKRLVLKEEVHIRHAASDETVEVPVTVRRQRAVVERVSPEGEITTTSVMEKGS